MDGRLNRLSALSFMHKLDSNIPLLINGCFSPLCVNNENNICLYAHSIFHIIYPLFFLLFVILT